MAIIDKPSDYFNTKLYTGNGSTQSITGVGFQPDWVWIKERNNAASHKLYDIVRGATEVLESDGSYGEGTDVNGLTAFDSNGFSLGSSGSNNGSGDTYASWNWKAGGTASSNTDGSITSNVSANTTSGFSIIEYTGTGSTGTIAHGLNSAPELVILRNREVASNWWVWGELLGNNQIMELDTTSAKYNPNGNYHNDTMPTSSVISIGSDGQVSGSGQSHICYAFHSVKSFSKIGSYIGNGNADGTFVYTGFKPAFVINKRTDSTSGWDLFDNKRLGYNVANRLLAPNTSDQEATSDKIDLLSNGFKMGTTTGGNYSGASYIYMAFASEPFTTSTGIPCTAR